MFSIIWAVFVACEVQPGWLCINIQFGIILVFTVFIFRSFGRFSFLYIFMLNTMYAWL